MFGDIRRALDLGRRVVEMSEEKNITSVPELMSSMEKYSKNSPRKLSFENEVCPKKSQRKSVPNFVASQDSCPKGPSKKFQLPEKEDESASKLLMTPKKCNVVATAEASPVRRTPRKLEARQACSPVRKTLKKLEGLVDAGKTSNPVSPVSPVSPLKVLPRKPANLADAKLTNSPLRTSPRKLTTSSMDKSSPRKSPRKLNFNVNSKDVLSVVKDIYGTSKNFKACDDSSFPLHQKLVICTLLLVMKKGKSKDLNVGRVSKK